MVLLHQRTFFPSSSPPPSQARVLVRKCSCCITCISSSLWFLRKTWGTWGQIILCLGGCGVYCRVLNSTPGLYILDTISNVSSQRMSPALVKSLQERGSQSHIFLKAIIISHLDDRCLPPPLLLVPFYCMRIRVESSCYQIMLL